MMSGDGFKELTGDWDYAALPQNVMVGRDCWIERKDSFASFRSVQQPGLVIGDRVCIYMWTTFNVEPSGCIEIGNDSVLLGPVFMCAQRVQIGQRVVISYHVTIADSDFHPIDAEARRRDAIANAPEGNRANRPPYISRPVIIEDDARIGIGAIILKGVTIGQGAEVGAGAVVTRDVPPGQRVVGNPALADGAARHLS